MKQCPLCRSSEAQPVERYRFDDIWDALLTQWAVELSPEVRAAHAPREFTTARRCAGCGLEWFAPAIAGDTRFYDELMRCTPYVTDRWEFGIVAGRVRTTDHVVDLGCGDGALIRRVARHVARAIGVDTNERAVQRLRSDGYEASSEALASFAARESQRFDVVCAFQIAEHLEDLELLVAPARALLRPNGRLFLSVPNRHRLARAPFEPLDLPPHHLSRWARPQLEALGRHGGLTLVRVLHSPPTYGDVVAALDAHLKPRLGPGAGRIVRRALLGPHRHDLLSRTGTYQRAGLTGHTMLAEYRLPDLRTDAGA